MSRACIRALPLESLEARTLLSTLPLPNITTHTDISGGGSGVNQNTPAISYDPANPQKLVTVYTTSGNDAIAQQTIFVSGKYSVNGGATWQSFSIPTNNVDPFHSPQNQTPQIFERATDARVAFDLNENLYLVYSEHSSDNSFGQIVMQKYSFTGNAPVLSATQKNVALYSWGGLNAANTPALAVDTNPLSYTDPDTGKKQVDPLSNSVYVAWSTDDFKPNNAPANFNPNAIRMIASADGGLNFSPPVTVNENGNSAGEHDVYPQLVVSQGTSDGRVKPGALTIIWDDIATGRNSNPKFDIIKSNTMDDPSAGLQATTKTGGPIADRPQGGPVAVTTFNLPVSIADPTFSITDLNVSLSLGHESLSNLQIELQAPNGTKVTLVQSKDLSPQGVNNQGINGQELGTINGFDVPVTFDQQATRVINDTAYGAPYTGSFRPELGSLNVFNGLSGAAVNGTWKLIITDNTNGNIGTLHNWTLSLGSGLTLNGTQTVATTTVLGALPNTAFPLNPNSNPTQGIGPGAVIASDNTLGSFSAYQGRLYVAYVDRTTGGGNPADNTDIYLAVSDDGGTSWQNQGVVNDDDASVDGFSETLSTIRGRPQFQPSVAVDQSTGTLVLTWYDARNDPSRGQVAMYIATSIDGGQSYSPQTFLNTPNAVTDAITGKVVTRGPIPDNQSNGPNVVRESTYGFGWHQAVAAVGGHVYPVWSGNLNGGVHGDTLLHIYTAATTIAAGPRIIRSTMGPVSQGTDTINPAAQNGSPQFTQFQVVFDRPVDPATFTPASVQVFFRSPTTVGTSPGTAVAVASVVATDAGVFGPGGAAGATTFLIKLLNPQTAVGTYTYYVTPDIRDRVRSLGVSITPGATTTTPAAGAQTNLRVPTTGTGGTGTANDITNSTIAISNVPLATVISSLKVSVNLTHTFDDDLILTLVAPDGRRIVLSNSNGGGGQNYTNTIFDDAAGTSIVNGSAPFTGSFRPQEPLSQLAGLNPNGTWTLEVKDTASGDIGNLTGWSLSVTAGTSGPNIGNKVDQNGNGVTAEAPSGFNGAGDYYSIPSPTTDAPFTGAFFLPPFSTDTAPIIVTGPHIVSSKVNGNPVTTDNLVLNKTVSNIDITFDRPMDASTLTPGAIVRMFGPAGNITGPFTVTALSTTTYRIGFPAQTFSGTYTVTLASTVKSAAGDSMDNNLNAGLDALRDISDVTVPVTTAAADLPQAIGTKIAQSVINITDAFLIKSASLTLNITYPNDPDLTATLVAPDGTTITLFSNVGATAASKANFQNTVFDDTASTPIQNGAAPFFGKFNPQLPLSVLIGKLAKGKWTLQIRSSSAAAGTLTGWSLTLAKPVPGTGLGETAADQATTSFRIFTMDAANPQSHNTWTPVGPGSANSGNDGGRVGAIAVDPSDPSGNTVYAAGSGGGIWRTRNFLTTNPKGPTWVPLTDFGPTSSLNIGSIAVFGQNNDPNQSIIFAATGFGDALNVQNDNTSKGVGFIRSTDGGATWTLLDSTTNVDAQGAILPINAAGRDHKFVNTTAFKVLVDPKPTPSGDVIVYAALSGTNGGVWRSLDSGKHWLLMRAGQATDIVFDQNSGVFDALNNPTGNLQFLYGAFKGEGIFFSPNRGTVWNQLLGTTGDPLIRDHTNGANTAVGVTQASSLPNGAKGRITLAKPALTGNAINDVQYQGWLYALVADADETLDGLYLTKDFGQNWTKVRMPVTADSDGRLPSNDTTLPDAKILSSQGNYNQSLAVDPNNPAIVYVGGGGGSVPFSPILRVDTTYVHDAHAFYVDDSSAKSGVRIGADDPLALKSFPSGGRSLLYPNAVDNPYINLVRDPTSPFLNNASVGVLYADHFTNDGGGATWTPFPSGTDIGNNQHRIVTIVDPLTGKSRLIVGTDTGVFTVVDHDGEAEVIFGSQQVASGTRNGNLQLGEYNYGAVQSSNLAAQVAGAMFYAQANDHNGSPQSTADILNTGDTNWVGPTGGGGGVATDQTGTGTAYHFNWPTENRFMNGPNPAGSTDFFMVTPPGSAPGTGISRTFGLLQDSQPGVTPDAQWPAKVGSNFAVNPINKDQIIVSSQAGRIFATGNQGAIWSEIGNPSALDSSYAPALAYGAPDPNGPGGADAVNFFLYAGTTSGKLFVTFNGGGSNGNDWIDISNGLDGKPVQSIVTNPTRGSHEAYAVTQGGVYYMANSAAANPSWVKITGNVLSIQHNPFGDPTLAEVQAKTLTALVADWRYAIPDNLNNPTGPTHPALYISADAGVFRSFDKGTTWTLFPNADTDGAPLDGGLMPNVRVNDLDLGIGNIDPTTGQATVAGSPDVLLATTYGRGSFAIRIAPTIVPGTLKLVGTVGGAQPLTFSGISELTAFGNKVRISIYNLTNPNSPQFVAGWNGTDNGTGTDVAGNRTDGKGAFSIQVASNQFGPGTRIIGVRLTDDAGVVYTGLLTFPPAVPSKPDLAPASDTGSSNTDNLTNDTTPTFIGTADPGVKVTILSDGIAVGNDVADANGNWSVTTTALAAGNRSITATATDIASNVVSAPSAALVITIDVTPPAIPSAPDMIDASDTGGSNTDNITNITTPTFTGTAEKGAIVTLFEGATVLGTGVADINTGAWSILSSALGNGGHSITAKATDTAGNISAAGPALAITIDVILPNTPGTPDLLATSDDGVSNTDNITGVGTPSFTGTADPNIAVELLSDGVVVGSGTANGAGVWTITSSLLNSGTHSITARAKDVAGNSSLPSVGLTVQILTPPPPPSVPDLQAASDTGASNTDNITNDNTPTFTGTANTGLTVELLANNVVIGSTVAAGGAWSITISPAMVDGTYSITARTKDAVTTSAQTAAITVTIDTVAPPVPGVPDLQAASDTGPSSTDNNTSDNTPTFTGTAPANTIVELLANNTVFGTGTSDAQGNWTITSSGLPNGTYLFTSRTRDIAGNISALSPGLNVTISGVAPTSGVITGYTLINADTGQDIMEMTEGMTLDLSTLPAHLAIRANPNPTSVGSVKFGYDVTAGNFNANYRIESLLPYALFADSNNGTKYNAGTFSVGNHTLTGTVYPKASAGGTAGSPFTLHFTVKNGVQPPPTDTVGFTLVNADTGAAIMTITEGMTLDMSTLPAHVSVKGVPSGSGVASLKFGFDVNSGNFNSNFHVESSAPYSLNGDTNNGAKYTAVAFNNGTHTLSATPYSKSGATGTAGTASTVHFTVINGGVQPPPVNNTVTSFTLINADTDKDIRALVDGETISLASLPAHIAIRANTTGTVGSVKFGYDQVAGTFNANFRNETGAPYALFGDNNNGKDYNGFVPTKGAHTLKGTVYSGTGGTGTAQGTLTLHFTIT